MTTRIARPPRCGLDSATSLRLRADDKGGAVGGAKVSDGKGLVMG
jgi:hypothetical protein